MAQGVGATVKENTVASHLSDVENCISRLEEQLSSFGVAVNSVNDGAHRPPACPETGEKLGASTPRASILARLALVNRRLYECNERFNFELSALTAQLPQ